MGANEIEQQLKLLQAHRSTLSVLLKQLALQGTAYALPGTMNTITEARGGIARCKTTLRSWGVMVEDHPDDDPSSSSTSTASTTSVASSPSPSITYNGPIYGVVGTLNGDLKQNIMLPPPAPAPKSLFDIPPISKPFVGRDNPKEKACDVLKIAAATGSTIAIGIVGMPGIGKTELAQVICHYVADNFPYARMFLPLRGSTEQYISQAQALRAIINKVEPGHTLPDSLEELAGIYQSILAGKQVLILADDMRDSSYIKLLMPPSGGLLFTSRQSFGIGGIDQIALNPLSQADATALLLQLCTHLTKADAETIAGLYSGPNNLHT